LESPRETPPPRLGGDQPRRHSSSGDRSSRLSEKFTSAKGRSCSTSMAWGVHSSQPWVEVSNTINIKYILPHHRIGREESRKTKRRTHKSCCIRQDQQSTLTCKGQNMTKPKNKSTPKPRMV
jgi:hypothetical protein